VTTPTATGATPKPYARVAHVDYWRDEATRTEYRRRGRDASPREVPALLAAGVLLVTIPLGNGIDPTMAVLEAVEWGTAEAEARALEERAYLAKHPEARPRHATPLILSGAASSVEELEAQLEAKLVGELVATSEPARLEGLRASLAVYGPLLATRRAGKRTPCAVPSCKREASVAVVAATATGHAYVCTPHGTRREPLVPAKVPADKLPGVRPELERVPTEEEERLQMVKPAIGHLSLDWNPQNLDLAISSGVVSKDPPAPRAATKPTPTKAATPLPKPAGRVR
jgi:hypothetical protein